LFSFSGIVRNELEIYTFMLMSENPSIPGDTQSRIVEARRLFPGARQWIYLDVAARDLISTRVRRAVDRYLDDRMNSGGDKDWMLDTIERVRSLYARLIHADPDEIAYTKNVSDGLNMVAGALSWEPGDNLVVCPEIEHPNTVYLCYNLRKRFGIEVRKLAARDGRVPVEDMVDVVDERTRLVTVPTVSFSPGFVTRIKPLSEACRRRGVFLLVDAAQSIGVLHTDVRELEVDALTVSTQKAMLGFYGMGFLYCRRDWAERLWPASLARFGVDLGDAHESALGDEELRLRSGARRFDLGNYNYLAAVAAEAAIELLLEIGTWEIEGHVRELTRRLAAGFYELGLPICGGPPGNHLGNIVAVGRPGAGHNTTSDEEMAHLHRHLLDKGVKLSVRRGVLRFSLHFYNNEEDVNRVLELVREWKKLK
jgi:selenocysteine lyase/cysteine desulfurase